MERCIKNATSEQEALLYAVLSGTGLRIAECLAIRTIDGQTAWNHGAEAITVRTSIYRGQEQARLKTQAASCVVDLDPRLNRQIAEFIEKQKRQPGSFLFQSKRGGPMHFENREKSSA